MAESAAKPRHRRLRFSLRSFMLLIFVIAVLLGLVGRDLAQARQQGVVSQ